jgi:hypothetical protein
LALPCLIEWWRSAPTPVSSLGSAGP